MGHHRQGRAGLSTSPANPNPPQPAKPEPALLQSLYLAESSRNRRAVTPPGPATMPTLSLEWDTLFIMVCSFLSGAMCALVWAQTFTTRVVNAVYDRETVAVAVSG